MSNSLQPYGLSPPGSSVHVISQARILAWIAIFFSIYVYQFSSVAQSCLTLCDPMDCSMPSFPVHHHPQSLLRLTSIELVILSNHLILCCPYISLQITRIIFCTNFREKKNNLSLAWPEEVYMHSNKENSAQLIRGPEKPHWARVWSLMGKRWERIEAGGQAETVQLCCFSVAYILRPLAMIFFLSIMTFPNC